MKLKVIGIIFLLLMIGAGIWQHHIIKQYKEENNRLTYNLENINSSLDSVKDKNGEMHNTISVLNLKTSELGKINSSLESELENMRIKLKNLENATVTDIEYRYVTDTIETVKYKYNSWFSSFDNNYISANWKSELDSTNTVLSVIDFNAEINDTIITATEIIYKGWWFWRKPKEIKLHIKSKNPYSNINSVESIKFSK